MALNFPANPAGQTPVNTYSPTSVPDSTTNGATYVWNGTAWTGSVDGVGISITSSATFPETAVPNDLLFNTENGKLYIYYEDVDSSQWVDTSANSTSSLVVISENSPVNPIQGELWWDSSLTGGVLYIYYTDEDSNQWVEVGGSGGGDAASFWKRVGSFLTPVGSNDSVQVGGNSSDGSETGATLDSDGSVQCSRTGTGQIWKGFTTGVATATSTITAAGSAYFNGTSSFGGTINTPNITLNANGSITAAGQIQSGGNTFGDTPLPGVILNNEGAVVVARNLSSIFIGKDTNTGDVTSEITYDGSATFVGNVLIGGALPNEPNISLNPDGSMVTKGYAIFSRPVTAGSVGEGQAIITTQDLTDGHSKQYFGRDGIFIGTDLTTATGTNLVAGANITLNADGNASFNPSSTDGVALLWNKGSIGARAFAANSLSDVVSGASSDQSFTVAGFYQTGGTDAFYLTSNTAQTVVSAGSLHIGSATSDASLAYAAPNITLSGSDGSASFEQTVSAGNASSSNDVAFYGVTDGSRACFFGQSVGITPIFAAGTSGESGNKAVINSDGSVSFSAGACNISSIGEYSAAGDFTLVNPGNFDDTLNLSASDGTAMYLGQTTSSLTQTVIGTNPSSNQVGVTCQPGGQVIISRATANDVCLGIYEAGTSGYKVELKNNGNATFTGALSKGSGSFKIDHPLPAKKDTHQLVHSFIEGPQADLIYRGKVDLVEGSAAVNIDTAAGMTEGTFEALCGDVQCFTSNETSWDPVKGSVSGNVLTIQGKTSSSTATISWMVVGERKDQHMLNTDWTDATGKVIVEPAKA